jgi:hypothetical protein
LKTEKWKISSRDGAYLRRPAKATKAMPAIRSGGESHNIPKFATRFKLRTATAAAVTSNSIPITRRVLADNSLPPLFELR